MNDIPRPIDVLLVEDNPGDVDLTRVAFRRCKIANNVIVARNGQEAMQILRRQMPFTWAPRPDVILLDLDMPVKSGYEVLDEVKSDPDLKTIPILVLTSSAAEEDVLRSYGLHANGYITKPIALQALETIVRSIDDFWFQVVRLPRKLDASLRRSTT